MRCIRLQHSHLQCCYFKLYRSSLISKIFFEDISFHLNNPLQTLERRATRRTSTTAFSALFRIPFSIVARLVTMDQAASLICALLGIASLWYFRNFFISRLKKQPLALPPAPPSKTERPFEKTYRVQGLPLTMTSTKLESLLKQNYKLQDDGSHKSIKIGSLAEAPDGRTCVATVSFFQRPSALLKSHQSKLDFTDTENETQDPRPYYLTIEDKFLGLTTLYSPKEDEHQLEFVASFDRTTNHFADSISVSLLFLA